MDEFTNKRIDKVARRATYLLENEGLLASAKFILKEVPASKVNDVLNSMEEHRSG